MEGMKYMSLIEIGLVVIEIRRVQNGELAVPVNNTLESHSFLGRWHTTVCLDSMHYAKNYSRIIIPPLLQSWYKELALHMYLICAASNDMCGVMTPFAHRLCTTHLLPWSIRFIALEKCPGIQPSVFVKYLIEFCLFLIFGMTSKRWLVGMAGWFPPAR